MGLAGKAESVAAGRGCATGCVTGCGTGCGGGADAVGTVGEGLEVVSAVTGELGTAGGASAACAAWIETSPGCVSEWSQNSAPVPSPTSTKSEPKTIFAEAGSP